MGYEVGWGAQVLGSTMEQRGWSRKEWLEKWQISLQSQPLAGEGDRPCCPLTARGRDTGMGSPGMGHPCSGFGPWAICQSMSSLFLGFPSPEDGVWYRRELTPGRGLRLVLADLTSCCQMPIQCYSTAFSYHLDAWLIC